MSKYGNSSYWLSDWEDDDIVIGLYFLQRGGHTGVKRGLDILAQRLRRFMLEFLQQQPAWGEIYPREIRLLNDLREGQGVFIADRIINCARFNEIEFGRIAKERRH